MVKEEQNGFCFSLTISFLFLPVSCFSRKKTEGAEEETEAEGEVKVNLEV